MKDNVHTSRLSGVPVRVTTMIDGKTAKAIKTDKNTWLIQAGKAKEILIEYEVYAFEVSVRTSFLDLTHGFVSGSGVFMYVDGHKDKGGIGMKFLSTISRREWRRSD